MADGTRTIRLKFTDDAKGVQGAAKDGERAVKDWESSARESMGKVASAFKTGGAIVAAGFVAGFAELMNQGDIAATMAAQLGGTPAMAGQLGAVAGKVYANNFGASLEDAARGVRDAMRNGLIPEDAGDKEIQAVSEKLLTVGTVAEESTDRVALAVQQMLRNGLAKNATEAFDIITRGVAQNVNKSGDLIDTFNEYSTQFRDLGLDGKTALGLLQQGLQGGARDADTVADGLKEFAIRSKDGSKTSVDAFKKLGLNGKQMTEVFAKGGKGAAKGLDTVLDRLRTIKDPVERNAIAVALFGTKAEDMQKALLSIDPSSAVDALGNVDGATQKAADTMASTASAQMQTWWRTMKQNVVDFIGGKVIPALREWWSWMQRYIVPAIQAVVKWVKDNASWLKPLVVSILGVIAVFKTMSLAVNGVKLAFDLLKLAVLGNPILTVIALIVGAVIYLWQTSSGFRDAVKKIWQAICDAFTAAKDWIGKRIADVITFFGKMRDAFTAVKDWIGQRVSDVVTFFTGLPGKIWEGIKAVGEFIMKPFREAFDWVVARAQEVVDTIKEILTLGLADTKTYNGGSGTALGQSSRVYKGQIPGKADGGYARGLTWVGEEGPELMDFGSRGARIYSNGDSEKMASGSGSTTTVMVTIPIDLGDGVRKVVQKEITVSNRRMRRRSMGTVAAA